MSSKIRHTNSSCWRYGVNSRCIYDTYVSYSGTPSICQIFAGAGSVLSFYSIFAWSLDFLGFIYEDKNYSFARIFYIYCLSCRVYWVRISPFFYSLFQSLARKRSRYDFSRLKKMKRCELSEDGRLHFTLHFRSSAYDYNYIPRLLRDQFNFCAQCIQYSEGKSRSMTHFFL
jgi:hypothetical protein